MTYSRAVAPGELALVESFCNSVAYLHGTDEFADAVSAATWLRGRTETLDVDADESAVDRRTVNRWVRLREVVRAFLDGERGENVLEVLNAESAASLGAPRWSPDGTAGPRVRGRSDPGEVTAAVLRVLAAATDAGELRRLKVCRAADCRWVFYDRSPAANSSWCSMETCGSRHKMRAYRSRRVSG